MPEYLAPGVYVEETSFRPKTIEGVSTSTTGFVGPTRYGPTEGKPELITSFTQFERIYGGLDPLFYQESRANYMAHAVRAFFDNGGSRLYIARTFKEKTIGGQPNDGIARTSIPAPAGVIKTAYTAAENAVAASRNAVSMAINAADAANTTAKAVLQAAIDHISAQLPSDVDPPVINLDTADVDADITSFITGLTIDTTNIVNAKDEVQHPTDPDKQYIRRASAIRDANETFNTDASTLQTKIDAVTANALGDAEQVDPLPSFEAAIANAETAMGDAVDQSVYANVAKNDALTAMKDALAATSVLTLAHADERVMLIEEAVRKAETTQTEATDTLVKIQVVNDQAPAAAFEAIKNARIVELLAEQLKVGTIEARFPGAAGNAIVSVIPRLGDNVYQTQPQKAIKQIRNLDLVWITWVAGETAFYIAHQDEFGNWSFTNASRTLTIADLDDDPNVGDKVQVCSFTLEVDPPGEFTRTPLWPDLTIHPDRRQDGILSLFHETISNRTQELETPIVIKTNTTSPTDAEVISLAEGLIGAENLSMFPNDSSKLNANEFLLTNGNDGEPPTEMEYKGSEDENSGIKDGLVSLEDLEEISIVAAPGLTYDMVNNKDDVAQATQHLITHCKKMAYRVAVIDSGNDQSMSQIREFRAQMDSKHAALYYPWITIVDPISQQRLQTPPSGFVTGIYARNDAVQGVHKAPANEVPRGAIDLEFLINKAQQDVLNPLGINCLRSFESRGIRVWGARTISSDPEWKYLNLRRYFAFLERSIEKGTQWVVFENNGQRLWDNVRRTVEDFLFNEWKSGHLMGATTDEAYFVRCDRTTMTQNDWDNGRLICLVGVAPLRPAEFIIFRIGQKLLETSI